MVRLKFTADEFRGYVDELWFAGKLTDEQEHNGALAARALDMARGPASRRQTEIKNALRMVDEFHRAGQPA